MPHYYGPHLHHALACLRAGHRYNAVSWMHRDIGELTDDRGQFPVADSLRESFVLDGYGPWIEYETAEEHWQGLAGDGI